MISVDALRKSGHVRLHMGPAQAASRPADRRDDAGDVDRVPPHVRNAVLAVVLLSAALIRLRLASVPLERDEGEYAYAGQLLLQGVAPYQLVYNMKFPGVYYAYSVILALFGQTPWGIHVGLLLMNAATTPLLFLLARRWVGERAALFAAAAFAVLSLDRWIMGVWAHATQFVILPAVAGLLVLTRALDSRRRATFFGAGALLGTSVLMKQHAIVFVPLGLAMTLWRELRSADASRADAWRRAMVFAAGAAAPLVLLVAVLSVQGVLGRFWTWTFGYARDYVSEVSWTQAWPHLVAGLRSVTVATWPMWAIAAFGLLALWLTPWRRGARGFVTTFFFTSFLATCPGFYFREHYFIVMLPVVAMLAGVGIVSVEHLFATRVPQRAASIAAIGLFAAAVLLYAVRERDYLGSMSAGDVSRARYGRNPFIEAPEIGRYIERHTSAGDRIAVIGSEPEICFYARRRSATGYIYMYPLMERQPRAPRMQEQMIEEIERARPEFVVFVTTPTSWLARPDSDRHILEWANRYLTECYDVVGVAERPANGSPEFRWDAEATGYQPQTPNVVYTLRRKPNAPC